jgi:hypothetical protein
VPKASDITKVYVGATAGTAMYLGSTSLLGAATVTITDTFTDTSGLALPSHTGESGTWAYDTTNTGTLVISDVGRVRPNSTTGTGIAAHSASLTGPNVHAAWDFFWMNAQGSGGPMLRYTPGATPSFYLPRFDTISQKFQLYRSASGTLTQLAVSATTFTLPTNTAYPVTCDVTGTGATVQIDFKKADGTSLISFADTDATRVTTGTKVGLRMGASGVGNAVGLHIDNLVVTG